MYRRIFSLLWLHLQPKFELEFHRYLRSLYIGSVSSIGIIRQLVNLRSSIMDALVIRLLFVACWPRPVPDRHSVLTAVRWRQHCQKISRGGRRTSTDYCVFANRNGRGNWLTKTIMPSCERNYNHSPLTSHFPSDWGNEIRPTITVCRGQA